MEILFLRCEPGQPAFTSKWLFILPVISSTILPCFDLCVHIHHLNHSIHPLYWGFQSWTWSINKLLYCLILLGCFLFTNLLQLSQWLHWSLIENQHTIVDQFSSFMTRWDFAFCQSISWRMVILVSFRLFTSFSFISSHPPKTTKHYWMLIFPFSDTLKFCILWLLLLLKKKEMLALQAMIWNLKKENGVRHVGPFCSDVSFS